jgi:hypothetical protein
MEKQRRLNASGSRPLHVATLPGQNCTDVAGDMGGLDSADGDHLFTATRAPISAVRTRAFLWVLLLTYMTNRFAGKIEADAPLALATAENR